MLITTALPLILYFFVHALHGSVQGNWPAPVYPTLALVAAAAARAVPEMERGKRFLAWCRDFAFPFGVGASLIGLFVLAAPFITLPRALADQFAGWRGLAEEVDAVAADAGVAWIGSTSRSIASELNYHLRDQDWPIFQIEQRARYVFVPSPDPALLERPALIVERDNEQSSFAECFAEITRLPDVTRQTDRPRSYRVFLVSGPAPDLLTSGCQSR